MLDTIDSVLLFTDLPVDTIFGGGAEEPVVIDPVAESGGIADFIVNNWGELLIALLAFVKVVVNLTPTSSDNQVFGWVDTLINTIINDRRKAN